MRNGSQEWTVQETLAEDLEKLLCLEKAFMMSLPMMAQSAVNEDVQQEFERLSGQTREQITRIQGLIAPSASIDALPVEDEPVMHESAETGLKDCLLIAEARKKQHAKIALYSTACVWARQLGLQKMEHDLAQNLAEEEAGCERLLQLAHQVGCATA